MLLCFRGSPIVSLFLCQPLNLSQDFYANPRYDGAVASADGQHGGEESRHGIPCCFGFASNRGRRDKWAPDACAR